MLSRSQHVGLPICNPASGSSFEPGVHTVTCSALDAAGNSRQCTFKVTVHPGNLPPVPNVEVSPLASFPGYTNLIVIAPNAQSTSVTFDGSKSYDPDDTNFLFFWYEGTNLLSTNAVCSELLTTGTHEITLLLNDTFPYGTNTAVAQVEVVTPAEAVGILIDMVNRSNLGDKNKQPLLASLEAAAASFERGNVAPALHQLEAFEKKVRTQIEPFAPAVAADLLRAAESLITVVRR